jgi:hypothetical protein
MYHARPCRNIKESLPPLVTCLAAVSPWRAQAPWLAISAFHCLFPAILRCQRVSKSIHSPTLTPLQSLHHPEKPVFLPSFFPSFLPSFLTWQLLGRHSTASATPPALFALVIFWIGSHSHLCPSWPGLWSSYLCLLRSWVTGLYHHT